MLRYSESKIGISDPTVFVGQRVVDVIHAQQAWNRQFLIDQNGGVAPDHDAAGAPEPAVSSVSRWPALRNDT